MIRDAHPKVHVMSSFFYPKLSQSGYTSVRRWTKKVSVSLCVCGGGGGFSGRYNSTVVGVGAAVI